ncbi:MAG: hypothetical protein WCF28_01485 [Methanobacterium sp.]|uniref:hypothetical protein n=1 Tax=Methanobacterium sp. TaxID=2164 RepID=UPI003C71BA98
MESQQDINITEEDVVGLMDNFTKVPSFILKRMVSRNLNVVKSFENQIEAYKYQLTDMELLKIEKVMNMPVPELQIILYNAYMSTNKKQLQILADSNAVPFIEKNLNELEKVLF